MIRNHELDSLKAREQDAFQRKQVAFQHYAEARDRCKEAYDTMQTAWEDRCSAREEMNHEYDEMQRASENYAQVWGEYGRIRDENNYEIERLRAEADSEHKEMTDCFEKASECYECGDKSEAPYWSEQGREHKERRDDANKEVSRLCQEIRLARQNAEQLAPKTDPSAFRRAKEAFTQAKAHHESAQAEFKRLKAERDRLKAEFDSLQEEHARLKGEFQRKLKEVRAADEYEREVKYGTFDGKPAKVYPDKRQGHEGWQNVLYSTKGSFTPRDGHGHILVNEASSVINWRDEGQKHGDEYFIDASKGNHTRI